MDSMDSGEMMDTMHQVMPRMMENCFGSMKQGDRESLLSFCQSMLRDLEEKYLKK